MSSQTKAEPKRIGHEVLEITRPEKVLFPNDGITKGELVGYYERIAPTMLPYLKGRPISMERYPDGVTGERSFQKKAGPYFPDWIPTVLLAKQNGTVRHVICDNAATLVYLAGQAVITPHTWLSRADKPNHPAQLIFEDILFQEFERIRVRLKGDDAGSGVLLFEIEQTHANMCSTVDDVRCFCVSAEVVNAPLEGH